MRPTLLSSLLAAALLGGCANLAPTYQRPAAPVAASWPDQASASANASASASASASANNNANINADADASASASANASAAASAAKPGALAPDQLGWHDFITDERLRQVVTLTLANNRDLRVAVLNIAKARAAYRVQDAVLFPAVSANGAGSKVHTGGVTSGASTADLGFSSYELDLFGKNQNLSDAALHSYLSLADTRRSTQISLVAEVATAWLTLASDQQLLQLASDTLASQQKSYALEQRAHALGGASGLTLAQAQSTVDSARVDVATYRNQVAQDRNALVLLVGAAVPEALLPTAATSDADVSALVDVPAELPASVLQRRPDVLAAEHTLIAANADIGAARAAFYPSITLTATAGAASTGLASLFKAGSGAWTFAPAINLPIFNAGSNQATLDEAKATQQIDLATYEKTLQTAFSEVADALAQRGIMAEQMAAQASLVRSTGTSFQLSDALFRNGSDSYLDVLTAQRSLYTAQQTAITLRLAEQTNRLTLYKVLGGGAD